MSDTGSVEIGIGILCVLGSLFGEGQAVHTNLLLAAGAALAIYGLGRRKAWRELARHDAAVQSMIDGRP